jgi:hypothetical protein
VKKRQPVPRSLSIGLAVSYALIAVAYLALFLIRGSTERLLMGLCFFGIAVAWSLMPRIRRR